MRALQRGEAGLGTGRLLNDTQLSLLLRSIAVEFPRPDAVAIGLAWALHTVKMIGNEFARAAALSLAPLGSLLRDQ